MNAFLDDPWYLTGQSKSGRSVSNNNEVGSKVDGRIPLDQRDQSVFFWKLTGAQNWAVDENKIDNSVRNGRLRKLTVHFSNKSRSQSRLTFS